MTDSTQRPDATHHRFGPFITGIPNTLEQKSAATDLQACSQASRSFGSFCGQQHGPHRGGSRNQALVVALVLGWWVGVLLMIGSALFAIGGAMGVWPELPGIRLIDKSHLSWIFCVGSLFFTSAGYLQWFEVINGDVTSSDTIDPAKRRWLFYGWRPRNLGYLAVAAQLIGMLFFNISTADAFISGLNQVDENILVWTPNMLGSIFFMASALGSFVEPGHALASLWLADFGTFAGAVCFFVGGYLLIPEQFEKERSPLAAVVESS